MALSMFENAAVAASWCSSVYVRVGYVSGSAPVQPRVKRPLPLGLVPAVRFGAPGVGYTTSVVHDFVVSCPTLSIAVRETVSGPAAAVLIGTSPLGSLASPDSASEAVTVACTPCSPVTAVAGHVTSRLGGVASTCTASVAVAETLPTLSARVPLAVCEPLVLNVCGAVSEATLTPLGELPSASKGSPLSVNDTVTLSLYQP